MQIKILSVGKIKDSFLQDALSEYEKRLRPYAPIQMISVADSPCPETASPAEQKAVKREEGNRLLQKISARDYVVALCIDGKKYDSPSLATHLSELLQKQASSLVFVIGGSLGLSEEILTRANEKLSFSDLTFPHGLMRVLFLEQLYRSFRILRGEPYHK